GAVADVFKVTIAILDTWVSGIQQVGLSLALLIEMAIDGAKYIGRAFLSISDSFRFRFDDARNELKTGLDEFRFDLQNFAADSKKRWSQDTNFLNALTAKPSLEVTK